MKKRRSFLTTYFRTPTWRIAFLNMAGKQFWRSIRADIGLTSFEFTTVFARPNMVSEVLRHLGIDQMNIAFFGSSLLSAYWNGAATYYRGLIRSLAEWAPNHVL